MRGAVLGEPRDQYIPTALCSPEGSAGAERQYFCPTENKRHPWDRIAPLCTLPGAVSLCCTCNPVDYVLIMSESYVSLIFKKKFKSFLKDQSTRLRKWLGKNPQGRHLENEKPYEGLREDAKSTPGMDAPAKTRQEIRQGCPQPCSS